MKIKRYHKANAKVEGLLNLYNEVMNNKSELRMIIMLDDEDNYCMVDMAHDDGSPLPDGIVCWVSNNECSDLCKDFTDHLDAIIWLKMIIMNDQFTEAYVESF